MSSTLSAPSDGDTNRANELNALAWTWFALSSVIVTLRFYTRIRLTKNPSWDDWFMLITLVWNVPDIVLVVAHFDSNRLRQQFSLAC